jgi:hypothetical protein
MLLLSKSNIGDSYCSCQLRRRPSKKIVRILFISFWMSSISSAHSSIALHYFCFKKAVVIKSLFAVPCMSASKRPYILQHFLLLKVILLVSKSNSGKLFCFEEAQKTFRLLLIYFTGSTSISLQYPRSSTEYKWLLQSRNFKTRMSFFIYFLKEILKTLLAVACESASEREAQQTLLTFFFLSKSY